MCHLAQLVVAKRAAPGEDVLSDLARDDDLSIEELVSMAFILLLAGHETTANMLALGTFALLEHSDQLAELRANPELMPGAVEELMRYLSVVDVIHRNARGYIAFGHGVHQCLGQQLARLEMRAGFTALLRRFPTLALAITANDPSRASTPRRSCIGSIGPRRLASEGMEQRFLGRTGLKVSEVCLGTMTFGGETEEAVAHQMLDAFAEAGGTFIDTANGYSGGASEEIIGRWLKGKRRDAFVVATKVFHRVGQGANDRGNGRKHLVSAVEASLRRLGTDYIDLYQTHVFDENTPLEETLSTLDLLVRSGKVRFLGASSHSGWQLQKSIDVARHHGWEPYVCFQPLYNLLDRDIEWELVPLCIEEGLGLIAWSPLRMGMLTGKYHRGMTEPLPQTRIERLDNNGDWAWSRYANEHTWTVLDTVAQIGKETGKSVAQVSLRWLMQRSAVTAPIIGARTMAHFEDNLGAVGWSLSDDQMDRLNAVSGPRIPHPYDVLLWARSLP